MCMDLYNVQKLLQARVLTGSELMHRQIESCCGSDMMSDVLAFTKRNTLLCTGLTNMQVVRTADMTELSALVFVRGKVPDADIVAAAAEIICRFWLPIIPYLKPAAFFTEQVSVLQQKGVKQNDRQ